MIFLSILVRYRFYHIISLATSLRRPAFNPSKVQILHLCRGREHRPSNNLSILVRYRFYQTTKPTSTTPLSLSILVRYRFYPFENSQK